jgi:hypothetical protein
VFALLHYHVDKKTNLSRENLIVREIGWFAQTILIGKGKGTFNDFVVCANVKNKLH